MRDLEYNEKTRHQLGINTCSHYNEKGHTQRMLKDKKKKKY